MAHCRALWQISLCFQMIFVVSGGKRMVRSGRSNPTPRLRQAVTTDGPAFCGIAFMAKASAPGRTKTRLVPPLSFDEAAALNTTFLQDFSDNVILAARHAAPGAAIAGYAAYGPPGSENLFQKTLPAAIGLIGAWLPHFRECLFHTVLEIFARGHGSAVVLNPSSEFADCASDRNGGFSGAAGRARGARPVVRRRLLSARSQNRASPHVRRHHLKYRQNCGANAGTGTRDRS